MLRFITASLFLAVAVVLSITASDVLAAGKNEVVGSILTTGEPDTHAAISACAGGAASKQERYNQDCCDGLSCAVATALEGPSEAYDSRLASDAIRRTASDRLAGRNVAPETGPPKFIV